MEVDSAADSGLTKTFEAEVGTASSVPIVFNNGNSELDGRAFEVRVTTGAGEGVAASFGSSLSSPLSASSSCSSSTGEYRRDIEPSPSRPYTPRLSFFFGTGALLPCPMDRDFSTNSTFKALSALDITISSWRIDSCMAGALRDSNTGIGSGQIVIDE